MYIIQYQIKTQQVNITWVRKSSERNKLDRHNTISSMEEQLKFLQQSRQLGVTQSTDVSAYHHLYLIQFMWACRKRNICNKLYTQCEDTFFFTEQTNKHECTEIMSKHLKNIHKYLHKTSTLKVTEPIKTYWTWQWWTLCQSLRHLGHPTQSASRCRPQQPHQWTE